MKLLKLLISSQRRLSFEDPAAYIARTKIRIANKTLRERENNVNVRLTCQIDTLRLDTFKTGVEIHIDRMDEEDCGSGERRLGRR